jgi:WD40 repeat protein
MNTPPGRHPFEPEQILVDDEHPWLGLASFREQDEHFFKGREVDIDSLHNLVARERLTVLFGVSGLGKSSLLQAGLFPQLRQDNMLPVFIRLDFGDSAAGLVEQVFAAIFRQVQEKAIDAPAHRETETLWEYFHRKDAEFWDARNRIVIPLLCFDQLEEVFTLGRETPRRGPELRQLLAELADLVEGRCPENVKARLDDNPNEAQNFSFSRHPYKLIFSLREDYLADLEGLRELIPSIIHNRMRLRHMNGKQAMAVADQTQGRLMEGSVAETVVRLVAGEQGEKHRELTDLRIEPALLSLICRELNERRIETKAARINAQVVETNREQILENFYERSLTDQLPELRWFIEDKLITLSGFRNSEAYENALGTSGITAEALDQLVQCRLLRVEERDGVKRIELIHDVLTGVVRKSRDQRLILEKQRQAEQDRREAEQREKAARDDLRRSRRWTLALVILTGFAVLSSAWGWWGWWDAQQARGKAQHALAVADFREAEQHYQNNNLPYALAHLAHAVRTDPEWMSSRTLLVNLLQQRNWFLPVATFNQKTAVKSAAFSPNGTRVVTTSVDGIAQLWNAITGKPLGEPLMDNANANSVQFSSDGSRLVTSGDNSAQLWDAINGKPLGEAMTHQGAVQSAQFSPDNRRVLTISDKSTQLWDAMTGKPLSEVMLHQATIHSAQFSPDGTKLLTASDKSARLWEAMTGKPLGEAMLHQAAVHSAQFSPNGTRVLTTSDKCARQWEANTGKPLGEAMTHQGAVWSAQFSPNGARIVTASDDKSARVWDASTGKPLGEVMTHQSAVWFARFNPVGTQVLTASDKSAQLWDATTGKPLGEAMTHQGAVQSAQFSPDGVRVLTSYIESLYDGKERARLWDAMTGKPLGEAMWHQAVVWPAQFSPDSMRLLTASDKSALLWDTKTGKPLGEAMTHQDTVWSAQFSPDGTQIVTASDDNSARLWDAKTGHPPGEAIIHQGDVQLAQFSPDGTRVLTTSKDKHARLWDAKTGQLLGEVMTHQSDLWPAQFSPDGTRVLTYSDNTTSRLWDGNTGQPLGEAMTDQDGFRSAQFSSDGTQILTVSRDSIAKLWDAKTGKPLGNALKQLAEVWSAELSPDGTKLLTVPDHAPSSARLWDAKTGKPLGDTMTTQGRVSSAQFSPDGTKVLTISDDISAQLWDATTGKPLGNTMTHQGRISSAQFSPDSKRMVTASYDFSSRLWDAKTGKALGEAMTHQNYVFSARFSPDGTSVVTASGDKTARLWDAKTGKPLGEAMMHQGIVWSAQFSPSGTQVVTTSDEGTVRLWDVSPVSSDNEQLLAALAEAVAGNKLSELGAIETLENQIELLNNLRQQTAKAPLGEPTAESFIHWSLTDPWTRTVSPLSSLTVPEYIQQQIAAGRRDEVSQEFPGHPLLRPAPASKPK